MLQRAAENIGIGRLCGVTCHVPMKRSSRAGTPKPGQPASDAATYRDLLLFEERLKTNAARLRRRKRKYQCKGYLCGVTRLQSHLAQVLLLQLVFCIFVLASDAVLSTNLLVWPLNRLMRYLPILNAHEDIIPPPYIIQSAFCIALITLLLFYASGLYAEKIGYANRRVSPGESAGFFNTKPIPIAMCPMPIKHSDRLICTLMCARHHQKLPGHSTSFFRRGAPTSPLQHNRLREGDQRLLPEVLDDASLLSLLSLPPPILGENLYSPLALTSISASHTSDIVRRSRKGVRRKRSQWLRCPHGGSYLSGSRGVLLSTWLDGSST